MNEGIVKQKQNGMDKLRVAIMKGTMDQMRADGIISDKEIGSTCPMEVNEVEIMEEHWDDISGEMLDNQGVKAARKEEME